MFIIRGNRVPKRNAFLRSLQGDGTRFQRHAASGVGLFRGCHKAHHQRWGGPSHQDGHNGCATGAFDPSEAIMPQDCLTGTRNP